MLGSPILYLKGMRILMFQLSGKRRAQVVAVSGSRFERGLGLVNFELRGS